MKERAGYLWGGSERQKRRERNVGAREGKREGELAFGALCPFLPSPRAQTHQFHLNNPAQTPTNGSIKYNENRCLSLSSVDPLARPTPKVVPFGREKVR